MDARDLRPAAYDGAPFFVTDIRTIGNPKTVKKLLVNSDKQIIEDLGLGQDGYEISGVISSAIGGDYQDVRDQLTRALSRGGPRIFSHPFKGDIEDMVVRGWSISESIRSLDDTPLSITLEVSNSDGVPVASEETTGGILAQLQGVIDDVESSISDFFSASTGFAGNFNDAVDKASDAYDKIQDASEFLQAQADKIDDFATQISQVSANVTSLVSAPVALADSFTGLFDTVNGLYQSTVETFAVFGRLFGFGDDDTPIIVTTAILAEREKNRRLVNDTIQSLALGYSYLAASEIEFTSDEDIETAADILEVQYQKIFDAGTADPSVLDTLTDLRGKTQAFFDEQRLTARQIITVRTNPTSCRLLSYRYYGNSDAGDEIANLNSLQQSAFISGDVRILTV